MEELKTPSRFQIGDKVDLNFFKSGRISNATIEGIRFNGSSVCYDVFVDVTDDGGAAYLENVSSVFVDVAQS